MQSDHLRHARVSRVEVTRRGAGGHDREAMVQMCALAEAVLGSVNTSHVNTSHVVRYQIGNGRDYPRARTPARRAERRHAHMCASMISVTYELRCVWSGQSQPLPHMAAASQMHSRQGINF